MTPEMINTTIEILGKPYPIRCSEAELQSLLEAADFLNQKMQEVKESGKAINLERIAIITALNIAHQFLAVDKQKSSFMSKVHQRITQLQEKIDGAMNQTSQTELAYLAE